MQAASEIALIVQKEGPTKRSRRQEQKRCQVAGSSSSLLMANPNTGDAGQQPALRPEPYMGVFRRFRIKSDDAWTLAIQWGAALVVVLFMLFLVFGCYFHLPSPIKSIEAGTSRFSEQRYAARKS